MKGLPLFVCREHIKGFMAVGRSNHSHLSIYFFLLFFSHAEPFALHKRVPVIIYQLSCCIVDTRKDIFCSWGHTILVLYVGVGVCIEIYVHQEIT